MPFVDMRSRAQFEKIRDQLRAYRHGAEGAGEKAKNEMCAAYEALENNIIPLAQWYVNTYEQIMK